MHKVREILLNEYIGAITIGLVLAQAVGIAIGIIMQPIDFYLQKSSRQHSLFNPAETEFPWSSLVAPSLHLVLYLAIAFALLYWLYLKQTPPPPPVSGDEPSNEAAGGASEA
jgi:Mg/Co/Ni transporter MgtE